MALLIADSALSFIQYANCDTFECLQSKSFTAAPPEGKGEEGYHYSCFECLPLMTQGLIDFPECLEHNDTLDTFPSSLVFNPIVKEDTKDHTTSINI